MTVGLYATIPQGETDFLIPAGPIHQETTTYNQTFTQPGPAADSAWESMFPRGLGFVKHPTIAPNHSVLAVFHQLHCMNLLRIGFYAAVNGTLEEMQMQHMQDINQRPDPKHISHCFDYLRQALMCAVDTNLEAVDPVLGGSKGYGYARTCRDFDAVKAWSDEWAYWKNFTISA
ncbi:hypothetical protein MMC13_003658 [Lambiella insularis]|nr:hypothetical protein [Lambiella insularis]